MVKQDNVSICETITKTTHRIHEEIAVDLSIILLHLLLKLCSRKLHLHTFNLFILKGAVTALSQQVAALIYKTRAKLVGASKVT